MWKKYAAQLVCHCFNKLALRKSKQTWNQDRMFLTCYKKECNFFMRIDQPMSHDIKERLSYSLQPQVTRFHPYEKIKDMFDKNRQEAKQKTFIQHQSHTKDTLKANTYLFNVMSSPPKNVKRLKTIKSYLLILELLYKMHLRWPRRSMCQCINIQTDKMGWVVETPMN